MSETDSTVTRSSTFSNDRRKRKRNATSPEIAKPIDRTNKSHTTYFFRKDTDDNEIAYCILCERKLAANRKPYPYSRKGGSTSNLAVHLRDKHGVTKNNYLEYLDVNNEPKENDAQITNYRCSETRQQELMRLLIIFIIKFVQPLYILQNDAFRNFVHSCEPGFQIPCEKTAKKLNTRSLYLEQRSIVELAWQYHHAQRLRESQFEINNQDVSIIEESQIQTSPLDVLSDTKT
ncbi:hypothetical protein RhiirA1_506003 [Rhizophagus irregularis]|uniref:BED-type domain-containing protein n=1 Tax=Rhizophagus irregularis TaxID=588596 RepID=A0A2N0SHT7_9GLOM|nr:hypothetical protein RhiirA1_506003 [Rhizophagus irregularis]